MGAFRLLALPFLQIGSFVSEAWTAANGETPHSEVPPLDPSFSAIGEAVLDRTFTLAINLMTGVPNPTEVREAQRAMAEAAEVVTQRGWLKDPRSFHRTPPPVKDWNEEAERSFGGSGMHDYMHLSFESGYRPHPALPHSDRWNEYRENQTAHAYVLEHEGEPDRPWVVCIHGFTMGSPLVNLSAFNVKEMHEELGYNILMPVLPLHGPRGTGGMSGSDLMSPDFVNLIHVFAQGLYDVRSMLGWLRARGADKIGLWGVSLGGYTTALVAAFDGELDCVIAGIPPSDFPNVARDNQPWVMQGFDIELATDWHSVRQMTHMVSPLTFDPLVPKESRFIYAGIADRVVRPDQTRALWRHWERPEILWYSGGHVASQFKREVLDFVKKSLADSGMPPVHTSEAKAQKRA